MHLINNYRFRNWAQNEACTAQNYYQPETESELVEIVKKAQKIRMVGTGHSWNAICLSNDTLVNLDRYNKLLWVNKEKLQVRVQAGIKLWQLNTLLDKEGLALKNLGSIAKQSIAGAISTGTHGSGINYKILGSQIEEFTLIKANGEKLELRFEGDKELFNKCLVNLGCLGIISEITLNVDPAFNLHDHTVAMPYKAAVENLDELVQTNHHFKMWWFPHTEKMVLYRYNRTVDAINDSRFRQWFMDEFVSVNIYRLLLRIGSLNRKWRKLINRFLILNFNRPLKRIEKSHKVFNVPEPPLHREVEWAFDISVAPQLLTEYKQLIDSSPHLINFIQEIRFTKGDEYALSACYGRDTIWLGVYNADNFGWKELVADFEQLAKKYKGRPHWGKEFNFDKEYLRSVYPEFDAFNALRKELDPEGKFTNEFVGRMFD
jgi:L-gulonolactone oxidase